MAILDEWEGDGGYYYVSPPMSIGRVATVSRDLVAVVPEATPLDAKP